MASRDYVCDECAYLFRTPPSETRDSPFVMCPACGSGFVSLALDRRPRRVVTRRAVDRVRPGDWGMKGRRSQAS